MASPHSTHSRRQASLDLGGLLVPAHIRQHLPIGSTILDVGAGWGKYRQLLPEYTMDACEIWQPYIEAEKLAEKYNQVFNVDICDFKYDWYDAIIFGDVFEHIDRKRAEVMLGYATARCQQLYIVVPYEYKQGEVEGNPYEAHQQPDLTDQLMRDFFHLRLLARDDTKGVYIK